LVRIWQAAKEDMRASKEDCLCIRNFVRMKNITILRPVHKATKEKVKAVSGRLEIGSRLPI